MSCCGPLSIVFFEAEIRQRIQSIDPGLPVFAVSSMIEVIDTSLAPHRFSAGLVGGFAGLAFLLASIGIYGLLNYMVSQRSREIGLRMTLGARPTDIIKLILKKAQLLPASVLWLVCSWLRLAPRC